LAKLELAGRYGEGVINWGYFPFMASDIGKDPSPDQKAAYEAYKTYYKRLSSNGKTATPCP
jgi:hypothetical protein